MNPPADSIHIAPSIWLPALGLFVSSAIAALWWIVSSRPRKPAGNEKDWSLPVIDRFAHLDTPFHHWDPRIKIAGLLIYWFCVASLTKLVWIVVALLISLCALIIGKVPITAASKRITALSGFIGMLLIVMPLTVGARPQDVTVVFDPVSFLHFNARGFMIALRIGFKAAAIALMMEPAFATAPFPVTIEALAGLGIPRKVCEMLMLSHRYIFVFQHEAKRMMTGMKARGFSAKTSMETLRNIGNFLGMLFVRSFERTERVYQAMLARGYQGRFPGRVTFTAQPKDWVKGAFFVTLGIILVLMDQIPLFERLRIILYF